MNIRAKFEEIWPVPDCIIWSEKWGEYMPIEKGMPANRVADEWDARLDTFTRCQETTDFYVSLVDEMVSAMDDLIFYTDDAYSPTLYSDALGYAKKTMERAKQITGAKE